MGAKQLDLVAGPGAVLVNATRSGRAATTCGAYLALTKPRIIELLLVTTVPPMVLANGGRLPSVGLVLATLVGGTAAAGGANALNMYFDRDLDRRMRRTAGRPLVTGAVEPRAALAFAVGLEGLAFTELALAVNALSAVLAVAATAFYIAVYTLWLKRTSTQNIVIGGAAGAVPVLVGWAAVRDDVGWAAVALAAVVFLWTPPHFWALAVRYRADYQEAGVPMLPAVVGVRRTARAILAYSLFTVAASLEVVPAGHMGLLYAGAAVALGAGLVALAIRLVRTPTAQAASGLFAWSIIYLTLLFAAVAADRLLHVGF